MLLLLTSSQGIGMKSVVRYVGCCLIGAAVTYVGQWCVRHSVLHEQLVTLQDITMSAKEACVLLGNQCARKGQLAQAVMHYQQALRHDDQFVDAHIQLSCVLVQQKKYNRGLHHYTKALELNPHLERMQVAASAAATQEQKEKRSLVNNYSTNLGVLVTYVKSDNASASRDEKMQGVKMALGRRFSGN